MKRRDNYESHNVPFVPKDARWENLRAFGKQPDIGERIDEALLAIERENPSLKGKLHRRFGRAQLEPSVLGELIDLFSSIAFESSRSGDLLGMCMNIFSDSLPLPKARRADSFIRPPQW